MRSPRSIRRWARVVVGAAAFATIGLGSGTAFAYFTSTAQPGSGSAATGTAKTITFSVTGVSSTKLYPGQFGDVAVRITDPYSTGAVSITGLTGTVSTSDQTNCPGASNFMITSSPSGMPSSVQPGSPFSGTLTNAVQMNTGAAARCQGVAVTVNYSVTGKFG